MKRFMLLAAYVLVMGGQCGALAEDSGAGPVKASKELLKQQRALKSTQYTERVKAAAELGKLGADAKEARIDLCGAMLDRHAQVRQAASEALEKIDPDFQAIVIPLCLDAKLRPEMIQKISDLGNEGYPAKPIIVHWIKNGRLDESTDSLAALMKIAPNDADVAKIVLDTASTSKNAYMRSVAIKGIPSLGGADHARCVTVLINALKADPSNRINASVALVSFGKEAKPAIDTLRQLKGNADDGVRKAAADALQDIEAAVANKQ